MPIMQTSDEPKAVLPSTDDASHWGVICRLLGTFVVETAVGIALFVIVGGGSMLLRYLAVRLEDIEWARGPLVLALSTFEYLLLICDTLLAVIFVIRLGITTARRIWAEVA